MRKGTLATQLAAARSPGGDAFGNDSSVWDKFARAEDRIDQEAIETEVDAAMRGEVAESANVEAKILALSGSTGPGGHDDALAKLKDKMAADKAERQKALEAARSDAPSAGEPPKAKP